MAAAAPDPEALAAAAARSADAARAWRRSAQVTDLLARLDAIQELAEPQAIDAVADLLSDDDLAARLLAPLVDALRDEPWLTPPLRVSRDGLRIGAQLIDHPLLRLSASVTRADKLAALPPPDGVLMAGRLTIVRYHRAGGVRLRRWQAPPIAHDFSIATAPPAREIAPVCPADGAVLVQDGRHQGTLMGAATSDVATLTAIFRDRAAPFMRDYATADGRLRRVAMIDEGGARSDMLLTMLRVMGRGDAGDCLAAATHDAAFFRRWSAMREWLALDAASAAPRLAEMASFDPHPEVRAAATATLPMLAEAGIACPA
ncbi:hypothetical protein ACLB0R_07315 [Sphingomonas sp. GlSt437]|uniref:hypothetical protein n=1 Tax=Sphingomonas sp. GlSt437 TaxID=3389970 RepID=UPI003A898F83